MNYLLTHKTVRIGLNTGKNLHTEMGSCHGIPWPILEGRNILKINHHLLTTGVLYFCPIFPSTTWTPGMILFV